VVRGKGKGKGKPGSGPAGKMGRKKGVSVGSGTGDETTGPFMHSSGGSSMTNSLPRSPTGNGPVNHGRRNRVLLKGARKIWGTLRTTTTLAVENALKTLTSINVKSLIVKRKFKTAHNNKDRVTKWWFVVRSEESILEQLQKEWPTISIQTSWRLEPILSYADDPASRM